MSRLVKTALLVNAVLCVLFVFGNVYLWSVFGGNNVGNTTLISSSWNPFEVSMVFHTFQNGSFSTITGIFFYLNVPFILFWVSTIVNLYLMVQIHRSKEKPLTGKSEKPV